MWAISKIVICPSSKIWNLPKILEFLRPTSNLALFKLNPSQQYIACKAVAGGDGAFVIELGKNLKKALFGD